MLLTGNESRPDDESYNLVIGMLFVTGQIDAALKYIDLALKSSYMLSMKVFMDCVNSCVNKGRLDTLAAIVEKCKVSIILLVTKIICLKSCINNLMPLLCNVVLVVFPDIGSEQSSLPLLELVQLFS